MPLTDSEWFDDDATRRLEEFLSLAWPGDEEVANGDPHLEQSKPAHSTPHSPLHEQNLAFLAANLSPKKTESSRDTIRRYLCERFYKDHLQTYKKRPIYWLFSSGKLRAFQCLVYLHRYNEGTLARMRMEYAVPLQGKLSARIDALNDDIDAAETSGTTAQAKRLRKQRDKRVKQLEELRRYNELLRHYADQRIPLDLDDGVKRNYGKFGPLLAEVRAVTGKAAS